MRLIVPAVPGFRERLVEFAVHGSGPTIAKLYTVRDTIRSELLADRLTTVEPPIGHRGSGDARDATDPADAVRGLIERVTRGRIELISYIGCPEVPFVYLNNRTTASRNSPE